VEKADRLAWFNSNLMPILVDKDPEAFIGFTYTGDFIEQLCDVQLTSESVDVHWESFTGHQLRRNKEEVQQLNRIHKSRYNAQLHLQVNPSQLSSLNSKAPVPITTMSELVAYIKRVWHCSTLFFPHCFIGTLAQELYKALLEHRRHLELNPDWLSKKPGEIVHYLWREADREFRHVIPQQELLRHQPHPICKHPNAPVTNAPRHTPSTVHSTHPSLHHAITNSSTGCGTTAPHPSSHLQPCPHHSHTSEATPSASTAPILGQMRP
jgi:hypothetical protein